MGKRSFSNACIYNGHGWNIAETGNCCMITRDGWSGMAMEVNALCSTRTDCLPFYASEKSSYVCSSPSSPTLIKLQQWKTQHLAMRVVRSRVRTVNKTVYANKLENGSFGGNLENGFGRKKLAVFVSGGGSNFKSLHQATLQGSVSGYVAVVVTDKPGCGGSEYAKEKDIPVIFFPKSLSLPGGLSAVDLVTTLGEFGIDFILLAGYLKLIPVELVRAYPRSILNIHPSLLPSFGGKGYYGSKVHKAVIASGVRYSGPTIHFVDEHYDSGRILAQRVVPVLAKDTPEELAARVLCEEHRLYVEVAAALCDDRIIWREDGVPLIRSKTNPNEYS